MNLYKLQKVKAQIADWGFASKYDNIQKLSHKALNKAAYTTVPYAFFNILVVGAWGLTFFSLQQQYILATLFALLGLAGAAFMTKVEVKILNYYQKKLGAQKHYKELCDSIESQQKPILELLQSIDIEELKSIIHDIKISLRNKKFYDTAQLFSNLEEHVDKHLQVAEQREDLLSYEKEMGLRPLGLKANL